MGIRSQNCKLADTMCSRKEKNYPDITKLIKSNVLLDMQDETVDHGDAANFGFSV